MTGIAKTDLGAKKLLLLTYHFPPSGASGSFRLLGFTRHLPKFGWQATVVAPPRMPWEPADPELARQIPPEVQVCSVPYPKGLLSKPLRRFAPYAVWLAPAVREALRLVHRCRPDAVLTSGPPHCVHLLGLLLRRHFRLPWVADFRDPWVADGKQAAQRSLKIRWETHWERAVIRGADVVVANAPRACRSMQNAYPRYRGKMITITNGYDPESFPPQELDPPVDRTLTILHAGELYCGRDPRPFLDALRDLQSEHSTPLPLRVRLVGSLSAKDFAAGFDLRREVEQRGLAASVSLEGWMPYQRVLKDLLASDLLLLFDTPGRQIGIPAKAYEYLGAGRPILALAERDGDLAWLLRASGLPHRIAPPHNPVQIKRALAELIKELSSGNSVSLLQGGTSQFTRETLAGRLADALNGCVRRKQSPDPI